jgi:transposase
MVHCYSLDLRVRVVAFVEAGHSCRAAARHFGVSDSFAIKLRQRQSQSGSPAPARQGRPPGASWRPTRRFWSVRWRANPTSPCRTSPHD